MDRRHHPLLHGPAGRHHLPGPGLRSQDLTASSTEFGAFLHPAEELHRIPQDAPENGFSIIMIPATSKAHIAYAQEAPEFPDLFLKPIFGWITGVHLSDLGKVSPKVFNGATGTASDAGGRGHPLHRP